MGSSFFDAAALMRIRNMELRARIVVDGIWKGLHRSVRHGFSTEFTEYRQYVSGDDPRFLDWQLYARSDRYYIRKFEEETNLRCWLLVDQSASMQYGSLEYNKADYARTLVATFAYFLHLQGDAIGLFSFADRILDYFPARNRAAHLKQIFLALERRNSSATGTDLAAVTARARQIMRGRGITILVSDLLIPLPELERRLSDLSAGGQELAVFQILDPAELHFTFDEALLLVDMETARELYVDPATARQQYLDKLHAHLKGIGEICGRIGATYHLFQTDRPIESGLVDYLHGRDHAGPRVMRARRRD